MVILNQKNLAFLYLRHHRITNTHFYGSFVEKTC